MSSSDDLIALIESCSGNQCGDVTVPEKIDFIINNVGYFENESTARVIRNNIINLPIHTDYDLDRFCKAIYDAWGLVYQTMLLGFRGCGNAETTKDQFHEVIND